MILEDQESNEIAGPDPATSIAPLPASTRDRFSADDMAEELRIYDAVKPGLLDREGQYALIKGTELVGVYPTIDEAEEVALARFDMEPVFVRQIRRVESPAILNILAD